MPALYDIRLTDATTQIGNPYTTLEGFGGDDLFSFEPAGEEGFAMMGALGDVALGVRVVNLWTWTGTFMTGSSGLTTLLGQLALRTPFPINVAYGDFTFRGVCVVQSRGAVNASASSSNFRTVTMACAYVSGNINAAPGTIITVF